MIDKNDIWSFDYEKNKPILPGQLLLSEPFMLDENFKRTVVLICDHSLDAGTVGLILNKPIKLGLKDLLEEPINYNQSVFFGGPVATDSIQFIHKFKEVKESIEIGKNLFWGGNFDSLKTVLKKDSTNLNHVRFYLGYSGWGYEQLSEELKENSWIIHPAKDEYVFYEREIDLWKNIMSGMGGVYEKMSKYPESPVLN